MDPAKRERLVRIGLKVVLGSRAQEVVVRRDSNDTIEVGGEGGHSFGFPLDPVLGDNERAVLEHDIDWLIDELSEFEIAWAKRLPECPIHPDSHPLALTFTSTEVRAICPLTARQVRSASY